MSNACYDYCPRCKHVVPVSVVEHPDGTEYVCQVCRKRVDFDFKDDVFVDDDDEDDQRYEA